MLTSDSMKLDYKMIQREKAISPNTDNQNCIFNIKKKLKNSFLRVKCLLGRSLIFAIGIYFFLRPEFKNNLNV